LVLVIVGGLVGWAYRAANQVLDRGAMLLLAVTIAVAAGVAVAVTLLVGR
jgi:hypothetical protein